MRPDANESLDLSPDMEIVLSVMKELVDCLSYLTELGEGLIELGLDAFPVFPGRG